VLKYFYTLNSLRHSLRRRICVATTLAASLGFVVGCSSGATMRGAPDPSKMTAAADQSPPDPRLAALWQERTMGASARDQDYPIGPGDVLTISVPEMPELSERKVRVSSTGQITLPLLGDIQAGGLTEEDLAKQLELKLEKYMLKPQAAVFVDQYLNRSCRRRRGKQTGTCGADQFQRDD